RALAGCHREWPLSRGEPGDGVAAGRFSRADGTEFSRPCRGAMAAFNRASAGDAPGAPSLRAACHPRRMAATDPDRGQPPGHRVWYLPAGQPAPSADTGTDTTDATGALVLRGSDRAWRGIDARADLSGTLS